MEQVNTGADVLVLQQQLIETQQKLIAAQEQIIALQKRLDAKAPKKPKSDKAAHWHIASGGVTSTEAANSKDLILLRKFVKWNEVFAGKYIKPYVDPTVYNECVIQMTRGLPEKIAALESKIELSVLSGDKQPAGLALVR